MEIIHEPTIHANIPTALPRAAVTVTCTCQWEAHAPDEDVAKQMFNYHLAKQKIINIAQGVQRGRQ